MTDIATERFGDLGIDLNPRLTQGVPNLDKLDLTDPRTAGIPSAKAVSPARRRELTARVKDGLSFHEQGDLNRAMEVYREVLLEDREHPEALYFTAIALSQNGAPEDKVAAIMQHAINRLGPVPEAHYNLGIILHRMARVEEAAECFAEAIRLKPTLIEAVAGLAGCALNLGDRPAGKQLLERASRITTATNPDSIFARSFCRLLLREQWWEGWLDYDARWKTGSFLVEHRARFPNAKFWTGGAIPGKHLYIHTEQGAGDMLQLLRFLPRIAEQSKARVITLEVGQNLVDLLAQVEGVDYVIATGQPAPEKIDYFLAVMSLPGRIGLTTPAKITRQEGWLRPVQGFDVPLPPRTGKPRVGIAWAGSSVHKQDRYRSITWEQWRDSLLLDPRLAGKIDWVSLQVGERGVDATPDAERVGLIDPTKQCVSFAHTADVVRQLDLIIAVDTATVHLAGSLIDGPETWVMIPASPDWRWGLEGERSIWYDRLRLIRQPNMRDWAASLTQAADGLATMLDQGWAGAKP